MNSTLPGERLLDDDGDAELDLIFLTEFRSLEQALVRAGFTRAVGNHGNAQPDWIRFARHIERRFRPDSSPELLGAVSYLLYGREKPELSAEELEDSSAEATFVPESAILRLAELILETEHQLLHGINFLEKPVYDFERVTAALLVVVAWSCCDPRVESLLAFVQ